MTDPPPTEVFRDDTSGTYSESLTMSATPYLNGGTGAPTGGEPIADVQSLSRVFYNDKGQVDEEDDYYDVTTNKSTTDAWSYSTTAQIGTAYDASDPTTAANYLATTYGYDSSGNLNHEADSSGTITDTTYDGLNRLTGQSFGTDDSGDGDDMVSLYAYQYDNGGVGDSNLTQEITYPGKTADDETADARVTQFAYDWRDRLVAEKDGVLLDDGIRRASLTRQATRPRSGRSRTTCSTTWAT
jgi:YD repeat-containing protein